MNDHDDLSRMLHEAVDDVEPRHGVRDLETRVARIGSRGPSRGWIAGVAAAAAVLVVTGGVVYLNERVGDPTPAATDREATVEVYYLGDTAAGTRLFRELHHLHGVTTSDVEAAVAEALGDATDPDYRSGFPAGTRATVEDHGDEVTVNLFDDALAQAPGHGAGAMALQALTWTVDAVLDRRVALTFTIDGAPAGRVLGQDVSRPLTAGAADEVLSPVSVDLRDGAQLDEDTVITGHAATFEGTVAWELRQGERVVDQGFTTAPECCTLSPFAFNLDAPPGNYTLVVHDTDPSGGAEGHGITRDTKDIAIR